MGMGACVGKVSKRVNIGINTDRTTHNKTKKIKKKVMGVIGKRF